MKEHSPASGPFFLTYNPSCFPLNDENPQQFVPRIFNLKTLNEDVPEGFNAVKIALDASVSASLEWNKEKSAAKHYIALGFKIFWELNLAIFSPSSLSLSDQTQYLTLELSLEHFRDTIWKELSSSSLGASIYQGPADFSRSFLWHEEQVLHLQDWLKDRFQEIAFFNSDTHLTLKNFEEIDPLLLGSNRFGQDLLALFCHDATVEYLNLLANRLPDEISIFIMLDATEIKKPLLLTQLLSKERFGRVHLSLKLKDFPPYAFAWEASKTRMGFISREGVENSLPSKITAAICLPSMTLCRPAYYEGIEEALKELLKHRIPFRMIPEIALTNEWDGLDYLLVTPAGIGPQGLRKLQGFCAAGGTIVSLAKVDELAFTEWLNKAN